MASSLGELLVKLGIDASSLKTGMNAAIKDLNKLGKQAEKGIGPIMDSIGQGLMVVGTAGVAGFGAAAAAGIKMNASLEQSKVAFTTMLGSAEKADAFLKEMRDFANKTPFEFNDLQDSAKKMLAFGFAAQDVKPMLTAVGDAVAGLGGGKDMIDGVTRALGQMKAKGKVSAEEMNQLSERGIPGWQMLADKMGLTTAEVMKLSEKGLIPADQAIQALTEGMEKKFGGMMDKQSKTMLGLFSTLKDTASTFLTQVSGPVFDVLKGKLDILMAKINEWQANGTLQAWADSAAKGISAFWDIGEKVFDGLVGAGKFIIDNWGLIGPILAGVLAGFMAYRTAQAVIQAVTIAQTALNLVMKGNPIALVVLAIAGLVAAGIALYQNWETVSTFLLNTWEMLRTGAIAKWGELQTFLSGAWNSITQAATDAWEAISSKVTEIFNTLSQAWNNVKGVVEVVAGVIVGLLIPTMAKMAAEAAIRAAETIASWLAMQAQAIATAVVYTVQAIPGIIASWASMAVEAAVNAVKVVGSWLLIGGQAITQAAIHAAQAALIVGKWLWMGIQSGLNAARMAAAWVVAMGPIAWVSALVVGLATLIISNWDTISAATERIWNKVKDIVSGVWNGITSGIKWAINGIIGLINGMIRGVIGGINTAISLMNKVPGIEIGLIDADAPQIPTLHSGGIYNAPTPGGEGLALLRDGELVVTPEQQAAGMSGRSVNITVNAGSANIDEARLLRLLRQQEVLYGV